MNVKRIFASALVVIVFGYGQPCVFAGALDSSGGWYEDGGRIEFLTPSAKLLGRTGVTGEFGQWSFRALPNRAIEFPDQFSSVSRRKLKHLVMSVSQGERADTEARHKSTNLNDWYKYINESIINNFVPEVRGSISAVIVIKNDKIDAISFHDLEYEIPFRREHTKQVPPSLAPKLLSNDERMKNSVITVLRKVMAEPLASLPDDVESAELRIVLAGDPEAVDGWWTDYIAKHISRPVH